METFRQMQSVGLKLDSSTLVGLLPSCALLKAINNGICIHGHAIKLGFESDLRVMNATIDMHAKCGCIGHAEKLFQTEFLKDEISWNTMIAGYAQNGRPRTLFLFFVGRVKEKLQRNLVFIVSIIPAYAQLMALNEGKAIHSFIVKTRHEGLVDEGLRIFESTRYENYIEPYLEHHACMVDLLGRAGKIEEAWAFIQRMHMKPDAGVWGALLGACRIHLTVEWDDAHKMRMVMHSKRLKKFLVAVGLEEKIATVEKFICLKEWREAGHILPMRFMLNNLYENRETMIHYRNIQ
ncbi:pentatricopeptide repeat-containing protein At2g01510, mitochondrial-like [Amborella trichopoda]|uniref:pentatricopeptide repeat-containing protein At2g01510, mitochondrial-like n=1 Tax=Amborella trichopoda TaxID=13333 RepID=UPI0005D3A698|nr:pentatricopeptide repeat-containing protein At2g01510, mitochondrial-like [Amborella trichopoda]|eukprot:XP_011624815.1 pentatricopeptide repeat-containing protein At2g01510, mitochondrial-like [Amborella trichopoda]